jgi:hypothetical protein
MNRLLALCTTAFVIVGCGRAVGPTPLPAPPPENAGIYALTGRVLDAGAASEATLPGVQIDVSDGFGHRQAFTDGGGHYSVDALGAGTWTVSVTKSGYVAQIVHLDLSGDTSMDFQLERAEPSPRSRPEGKLTRE